MASETVIAEAESSNSLGSLRAIVERIDRELKLVKMETQRAATDFAARLDEQERLTCERFAQPQQEPPSDIPKEELQSMMSDEVGASMKILNDIHNEQSAMLQQQLAQIHKEFGQVRHEMLQDLNFKRVALEERMDRLEGNHIALLAGRERSRLEGNNSDPCRGGTMEPEETPILSGRDTHHEAHFKLGDLRNDASYHFGQWGHESPERGGGNVSLHTTEEAELPCDCWGVSVYLICCIVPNICAGVGDTFHNIIFVYATVVCSLNLFLQFQLVVWVHEYIVLPAVHHVQNDYKKYHQEVFDPSGNFVREAWDAFPDKHKTCGAVFAVQDFLCVVLFLWICRISYDMKEMVTLSEFFWYCPSWKDRKAYTPLHSSAKDNDQTKRARRRMTEGNEVDADEEIGHIKIVSLTRWARIALFALITVPRLFIGVYLIVMGNQYLTSTMEYHELILQALSLEFIIHIDEILYDSCFPQFFSKIVENAKIIAPIAQPAFLGTRVSSDPVVNKMAVPLLSNILLMIVCVASVLLYYYCLQQVLPNYKYDTWTLCREFHAVTWHAECRPFQQDCFPYGNISLSV